MVEIKARAHLASKHCRTLMFHRDVAGNKQGPAARWSQPPEHTSVFFPSWLWGKDPVKDGLGDLAASLPQSLLITLECPFS